MELKAAEQIVYLRDGSSNGIESNKFWHFYHDIAQIEED